MLIESRVGVRWFIEDAAASTNVCGIVADIDGMVAVDAMDGDGVFNWTDRHRDITIVQFNSA